jgi:hypothetical protein
MIRAKSKHQNPTVRSATYQSQVLRNGIIGNWLFGPGPDCQSLPLTAVQRRIAQSRQGSC